MPDPDDKPEPDPKVDPDDDKPDPAPDDDEFDADRAKAKISKTNSENANLRRRLKELEPLAKKAKELDDASKTESQKLTEERDGHKSRADAVERELLRTRIALRKGLTEAQAKRLVGDTEEELEADADELLESFGETPAKKKDAPKGKPKERLRGGGDPEEEPDELDPEKLASKVSRTNF